MNNNWDKRDDIKIWEWETISDQWNREAKFNQVRSSQLGIRDQLKSYEAQEYAGRKKLNYQEIWVDS